MKNTLFHTDCLQLIPTMEDASIDAVVSDPPYGENMGYDGDSCLTEAEALLEHYCRALYPKLKDNGYIAIFWTMRNLDTCIDVLRSQGFQYQRTLSMYIPKGGARPDLGWLPRTQAIVIARKYLPLKPIDFHAFVAEWLTEAIDKSPYTKAEIAKALGCNNRLVMKWTRIGDPAWCLPTPRFYKPLKQLLSLSDEYDVLLTRAPVKCGGRSDFTYQHDTYIVEDRLEGDMVHPSQKPLSVVKHIVECLCPTDGIVFDGFAGSGTTAIAALESGRNYIACEISEAYFTIAQQRILKSQTLASHRLQIGQNHETE